MCFAAKLSVFCKSWEGTRWRVSVSVSGRSAIVTEEAWRMLWEHSSVAWFLWAGSYYSLPVHADSAWAHGLWVPFLHIVPYLRLYLTKTRPWGVPCVFCCQLQETGRAMKWWNGFFVICPLLKFEVFWVKPASWRTSCEIFVMDFVMVCHDTVCQGCVVKCVGYNLDCQSCP